MKGSPEHQEKEFMELPPDTPMPASSPSDNRRATLREKWRALAPADRVRLLAVLALLQVMDRSLSAYGLRRTQAWLRLDRAMPRSTVPSPDAMAAAQRLAELASMAGNHGRGNTSCLRKALAVQWWLRRRGLDSVLRLGVRKVGARLDAHAWIELDGTPLAQTNLRHAAFNLPDNRARKTADTHE